MEITLSNGDKHAVKISRAYGKFMARLDVLGFHAYGFTEEEAIKNLIEISKPYIKEIKE